MEQTGNQITLEFEPLLTPDEERVWAVVRHRRGRENAILGPVIAGRTGIGYKSVQEIISHLVSRHEKLIASCTRGYFVPQTEEEVLEATRSLRHRAIVILHRASRLQKKSVEDVFGQARMEFEKAG